MSFYNFALVIAYDAQVTGHGDVENDAVISEMDRLGLAPTENGGTWMDDDESRAAVQTIMEHGFRLGLKYMESLKSV